MADNFITGEFMLSGFSVVKAANVFLAAVNCIKIRQHIVIYEGRNQFY